MFKPGLRPSHSAFSPGGHWVIIKGAVICLIAVFLSATSWAGTISGKVTIFGKARKNVAVHLEDITVKVVPSGGKAVVLQKRQLFIPDVLPILTGTTVSFPNKDTVFHNAFSINRGNQFDFGSYGPGKKPEKQFTSLGKVDIFCNSHEQMHAVVMVLDHPYFDLTAKDGVYTIPDVPEGTYQIKAWSGPDWTEEKTVTVTAAEPVRVNFDMTK